MFKKIISIALLCCFIFPLSCATTKIEKVPVASFDYHKLEGESSIFVTTKDKQEYELVNFEITESYVEGTVNIRGYFSDFEKREQIKINLQDIEFILVQKIWS